MNIVAPFEATKISQTKPGDLIRIVHSSSPIGLIIHEEREKRVVGVLGDDRGVAPYHIVFQREFRCFRYAPDWVLELPRESAGFGGTDFWNTPGVVHVGDNGTVMNFASSDAEHNELSVNLKTFEWDDVATGSAAFPRWRIWASEADRLRSNAVPIFEFAAPTPANT